VIATAHTGGSKNFERGIAIEILQASEDRVIAKCQFII
jgi:hypothetical protein